MAGIYFIKHVKHVLFQNGINISVLNGADYLMVCPRPVDVILAVKVDLCRFTSM